MSGGSRTLFLCEAVPASLSLTRYLVGIGVVGVLVYMCSVVGVVSVVVRCRGVVLFRLRMRLVLMSSVMGMMSR